LNWIQLAELSIAWLAVRSVVINFILANNNEFLEQLTNQEYSSANWKQSEMVYYFRMPLTATWQQKTIETYIDLNLLHRNCIKKYKIADEWNKHGWNWYIKGLFFSFICYNKSLGVYFFCVVQCERVWYRIRNLCNIGEGMFEIF